MISEEKTEQALHALNGVLVQLRSLALRGEDHQKIATVADIAEQLPRFISSEADQTREYELALRDLVARYPEFGHTLHRFLEERAPNRW